MARVNPYDASMRVVRKTADLDVVGERFGVKFVRDESILYEYDSTCKAWFYRGAFPVTDLADLMSVAMESIDFAASERTKTQADGGTVPAPATEAAPGALRQESSARWPFGNGAVP